MRLERISISGHDREMALTHTLGSSCVFLCSQRSDGARKDVLRNINGARGSNMCRGEVECLRARRFLRREEEETGFLIEPC